MKQPRAPKPAIRERIRAFGSASATEVELLALILGHGHRGQSVLLLARTTLELAGSLDALSRLEVSELEEFPGLGPARASRIIASFELGRKVSRPRIKIGRFLSSASEAARFLHSLMADSMREEFHALMLDSRHRLLGHRVMSIGSLQSSIVHPREVFRPAIRLAAAALVVGHNHPSGDPSPSSEDQAVTDRLKEVGSIIGIQLLDHLVLGESRYHSFAEGTTSSYPLSTDATEEPNDLTVIE